MDFRRLIQWSQSEFRDLPWRKDRSLYRTLVSEIMLQQTTVGTVKNHYERFLQRFPDLKSLALASEEQLLVAWKGLGYYRRAKNLKKISEAIFQKHDGEFPLESTTLQAIPGIGPYTSQALIAIGMDKRGLAVDANLERVIARLYGLKEQKGPKLQKKIQQLFSDAKIFSNVTVSYRALNEALMDLGRTYCQARKASCELCPLKNSCAAFKEKSPLSYPLDEMSKKESKQHELRLMRLFVIKKDRLLVYKKSDNEWLSGQYEVPTFVLSTTDKKFDQYPPCPKGIKLKAMDSFKSGITKYKIQNDLLKLTEKEWKEMKLSGKFEWRDWNNETSNLSTATYKGLKKLFTSSVLRT